MHMEYKFLPEAVKNTLGLPEGTEPDFVLRGSGGISGRSGESYLIALGHDIFLFERDFGATVFKSIRLDAREPDMKAELQRDTFSSLLNVGGHEIKLSNFEAGTAAMLVEKIQAFCRDDQLEREVEPTPYLLLLMMLIDLGIRSGKDRTLAPLSENFIINEICSGNRKFFLTAKALYEQQRLEDVFRTLSMNEHQKRCMLANMLEMAMRDGEFSGSEQTLIYEAATKLGIKKDDFNAIWNVILDKNCLSILTDR